MELSNFNNVSFLDIKSKDIKKGIIVSSCSLVKGLEFDKVVVYGANEKNYCSEIDRNYFYIACSRAINDLVVLADERFTSFVGKNYEVNK
jgi:DNA helicase-2/ATP-dependent DNA helicase PcrA